MLPFSYEWSMEPGRLIFLGAFYTVLMVLMTGLAVAAWRSWRTIRAGKVEVIRWQSDFHDLPETCRACRHELAGKVDHRTCHNGFDCRGCDGHRRLGMQPPPPVPASSAGDGTLFGLEMPEDRLYSRGHTWVKLQQDGTYLVGLDDLGSRLAGSPDTVVLPEPGFSVEVHGTAWRMERDGAEVRILSPVQGEVVEVGGPGKGWYLRVKPGPEGGDLTHLLRGTEVRPWVMREMERLQMALSDTKIGASLADGGIPAADLPAAVPSADWDTVWGTMFLES
jgi:glycine cleavage system H protein